MTAYVLGGLIALSLFVMVYLSVLRAAEQTDELFLTGRSPSLQAQLERSQSPVTALALQAADRVLSRERRTRAETLLQVAGMPFRPAEWLLFRVSAGVVLGAALFLLVSPLAGVAALVVGFGGASAYPRVQASKRRAAFAQDLPDSLQLVSGSLRAGFSLPAALDSAATHARQPMAGELNRAISLSRLGAPLEDGLDDLARRMRSQEFEWVALAVRIQAEVGGNLSEILEATAETLRERFFVKGQVKALSAEGRLSVYILSGLPFLVGGWVLARNYDYARLLWTTPMGLVMVTGASVLMVVGWFWMRSVVRVEL